MAATSHRRTSGPVLRSLSPSGRFAGSGGSFSSASSAASAFASSTSTFTSRSSTFFHRSVSPTRVTMTSSSPSSSSSVRFSIIDRSISPSTSIASTGTTTSQATVSQKRTCMCSPTKHPGSFRCSLHKNYGGSPSRRVVPYQSNGLHARRSAMTNSLVRIGTVEGDLVKRALAALIRPLSHQQRRRSAFQPRLSRLSMMSTASDGDS